MFKRSLMLFLSACLAFVARSETDFVKVHDALPEESRGAFEQIKRLGDLDIELKSSGVYEFAKDRSFTLHTLKPIDTKIVATKGYYEQTIDGKTSRTDLSSLPAEYSSLVLGDISSLTNFFTEASSKGEEGIRFDAKRDVGKFIKSVVLYGLPKFPNRVTVKFANGDSLDIRFKENGL